MWNHYNESSLTDRINLELPSTLLLLLRKIRYRRITLYYHNRCREFPRSAM